MLRTEKGEYSAREGDIAIIPIAFPLTAGPGAITTVVLLTSQATDVFEASFVFIGVIDRHSDFLLRAELFHRTFQMAQGGWIAGRHGIDGNNRASHSGPIHHQWHSRSGETNLSSIDFSVS